MSDDRIAVLVFGYVALGFLIGMLSPLALDGVKRLPEGGEPAIVFTVGLLWPLSLVVGGCYALWCVSRALGRSFAVLWHAWLPERVEIPRATARERDNK